MLYISHNYSGILPILIKYSNAIFSNWTPKGDIAKEEHNE